MLKVDIGIFAYNEENNIKKIIKSIHEQDIFFSDSYSVKVYILANGCTDQTVKIAKSLIAQKNEFEIVDLSVGGKSRTWNRFVHEYSRKNADQIIFCDSDIWFPNNMILNEISEELNRQPQLSAISSRPVKDLTILKDTISFKDKIIASSSEGLNNWKTSICGQLYILKSSVARAIYLPIGLPVEDGYVRAMILTENMTGPETLSKISGKDDIFHFYQSERTIRNLINHQTRIVIGSAINYLIFNALRKKNISFEEMTYFTKTISEDENWLPNLIKSELPSKKFGWVPFHFLVKRLKYITSNRINLVNPKKLVMLLLGIGFDLIVYIKAQYKMARGTGIGYW